MDMPKISVVMPTYNAERYLNEAIDSVLNQTFQDFEFLIVDDDSTDNTLNIIDSYKDSRIKVISGDKKGIAAALNRGIKASNGEYIARMDADDISRPRRFELQIKTFEENPSLDILGTRARFIGDIYLEGHDYNEGFFENKPELFKLGIVNVLNTCVFCHPTVMFKKSSILKYNLFYDESYTTSEDQELWTRAIKYAEMANLNIVLLNYRWHSKNATVLRTEGATTALRAKINLLDYILPNNHANIKSLSDFEKNSHRINKIINTLGINNLPQIEVYENALRK